MKSLLWAEHLFDTDMTVKGLYPQSGGRGWGGSHRWHRLPSQRWWFSQGLLQSGQCFHWASAGPGSGPAGHSSPSQTGPLCSETLQGKLKPTWRGKKKTTQHWLCVQTGGRVKFRFTEQSCWLSNIKQINKKITRRKRIWSSQGPIHPQLFASLLSYFVLLPTPSAENATQGETEVMIHPLATCKRWENKYDRRSTQCQSFSQWVDQNGWHINEEFCCSTKMCCINDPAFDWKCRQNK